MEYLWVSLRLIYAFFLVLVFFQISGNKRQFSQMTTFDLISNFILSAILSGYIINHENLRQIQKTESWLRRKLKEMKVNKAEEVFYAQWQKGKLYVIKN